MNNKKRIYIAGRVSGLYYPGVCRLFNQAEAHLQSLGFEVVNPVKIIPPGTSWTESMRQCIAYLMACNYIAMLPGWELSRGATIEYNIAVGMEEEGKLQAVIHLQLMNEENQPSIINDLCISAPKLYPQFWNKEQLTPCES